MTHLLILPWLLYPPACSCYEGTNSSCVNSKLSCQGILGLASRMSSSYLSNFVPSKLCFEGSATARNPSFLNHVGHVVFVSAKKQMGRIDTDRVVTAMTDEQPSYDRANKHLVGSAMCGNGGFAAKALEISIALAVDKSSPQYTAIWMFFHSVQKPIHWQTLSKSGATKTATKTCFIGSPSYSRKMFAAMFAIADNNRLGFSHDGLQEVRFGQGGLTVNAVILPVFILVNHRQRRSVTRAIVTQGQWE